MAEERQIVVARVRHEQAIISSAVASGGTTSEQVDLGGNILLAL